VGYVLISHDISSVRRLAGRIAVMYRGRIVESGPAGVILENPRHPYTAGLISAVPVADPRAPRPAAVPASRAGRQDVACPVGSPCDRHGAGLHPVGAADHLVACTTEF
jgi:peptide/nickel transport system ATP-binding protein